MMEFFVSKFSFYNEKKFFIFIGCLGDKLSKYD